MRCSEAQRKSSAYLDGDLSSDQSSAVRGHLRECGSCSQSFEEEAKLIEVAQTGLPMLDPPDHIWQRIAEEVAQAEVADSQQHPARRWFASQIKVLVPVGLVTCAALVLVFVRSGALPAKKLVRVAEDASLAAVLAIEADTVAQVRAHSILEADADYRATIVELRELLDEDRPTWSAAVVTAVDTRLSEFEQRPLLQRLTSAESPLEVSAADPLYAGYRAEIVFLQSALAGQLPGALP